MRKTTQAAVLALSCLAPGAAAAADQGDFEAVYREAKSLHAQAGEHQWTTTRDLLKDARAAADEENYGKALDLAEEARALAAASVEQKENQAAAWKHAVVR